MYDRRNVLKMQVAIWRRWQSTSTENVKHKVLVVGAGTGGLTVAAKLSKVFNSVAIVEPQPMHYYQPLFTLVGAGLYKLEHSKRSLSSLLPNNTTFYANYVREFQPSRNCVQLNNCSLISYDYLVVAIGLQFDYEQVSGLLEALRDPESNVCTNYSPEFVEKTFHVLEKFRTGNAIFTFPNSPVKCPGAPQKICYLVEDYLRQKNRRNDANIFYCTALPVLFGVKKYADSLWTVVRSRNIDVKLRTNLIGIDSRKSIAIFENLDNPNEQFEMAYNMLHVTPPMQSPDVLKSNAELGNTTGFLDIDKSTLQHLRFPNIFGIGDCTSTPNSKTAAAIASQSKVLCDNLVSLASGKPLLGVYDGYASCPLVTSYTKCILAEFDYNLQPMETFPFDQSQETRFAFVLKSKLLPFIYWKIMLNGHWNGPRFFRNFLHFNFPSNQS